MPVTVQALLNAPELHLTCLSAPPDGLERVTSWVSTTELPDPTPFLRGNELVMTTGLVERTPDGWKALIDGLARVPIAALCFGTGLVHSAIPQSVISAAYDAGLVLLESPTEVPFVQISRWVADRIFAEEYDAVERTVRAQDELLSDLVAGRGLPGLLRRLHRQLDAGDLCVIDDRGEVLGIQPRRSRWLPDDIKVCRRTTNNKPIRMPILVGGRHFATLCSQRPSERAPLASYAATALGLELARHQAVLTASRELLGQVIEDVVHRVLSEAQARRRLLDHGVDVLQPHRVLVATAKASGEQLRDLTWAISQPWNRERPEPFAAALVEDSLAIIASDDIDAKEVGSTLLQHLNRQVPQVRVGISAARTGVAGLRLSFYEARHAAHRGPGVHQAAPLSVAGLLLGNLDLPLADLGRSVLAPLLAHDRDHGSDLIGTLRVYLEHDCRPAETGQALRLHRNSLRYRLQQMERLTGRDLSRLHDRLELWFALAALDSDQPDVP